jgi:SAM-dependent methyltransferase
VDVGCGTGAWLSVFQEHGVDDVFGIDGEWAAGSTLAIRPDRFRAVDLRRPFQVERRFDLAVSLEVAEHLPGDSAQAFVASLVGLAPVVLFSAAIPFQGGTGHVNEQWPDYWVKHFAQGGYAVIDCIRRSIWENGDVEWYYAQNMLLFASRDGLERSSALQREYERSAPGQLSLVHPRRYLEAMTLLSTARDVSALIPSDASFVLVDHEMLRPALGGRAIPFLERDGQCWGSPASDAIAIQELERLRRTGAQFIVFAWPAFWWLEHYGEFNEYLRSRFSCVASTERLVAFDLRG